MKKLMCWLLSLGLALSLAPGGMTVKAATVETEDGTIIKQVNTPEQLMKTSQADIDGGRTLLVDPADGTVEAEDGAETKEYDTISDRLPMTKKQEAELTDGNRKENKEEMKDFFEDSGVCLVSEEEGKLSLDFPFGLKRIIVRTDSLSETCGADCAVYYAKEGEYLLTYETDEQTREAYEAFCKEYGEKSVILDLPVQANDFLESNAKVSGATDGTDEEDYQSWGVRAMGLRDLRNATNASSGSGKVTVAVLDSGINKAHEMFSGRTILSSSKNFVPYESSIQDLNGHGTHVAGTVVDGTSSQVQLLILKVLDSNCSGSMRNILAAVEYATAKGADVINMSLSMKVADYVGKYDKAMGMKISTGDYLRYCNLFYKMAKNSGAIICASSGNHYTDIDATAEYPAASPHVLAVGSISADIVPSSFSNYGSVEFAAPGEEIYSASHINNTGYVAFDGTSMACPHVSAAMAMIKLYHPTYNQSKAVNLLKAHCYDVGNDGKDKYTGYGVPVMNFLTGSHNVGTGTGPAKVTGLKSQAFVKGIKLTWNPSSGASGYVVYRKQGTLYMPVKTITGTGISISGLNPKKLYRYRVAAYTAKNGKRYYSAKSGIVSDCPLLPATTKIKKIRKKGAVKLTWRKVAGASGYAVFRSPKKYTGFKRVALTKKPKALIKGKRKKKFFYIVKAYRKIGGKKYFGVGRRTRAKNK